MSRCGCAFLMYHEVEAAGRSPSHTDPGYVRYVVKPAEFKRQMQWLASSGRRGISVGDALASAPDNSVVLTFDDGCETDLCVAAPLLKQLGFSATFYVTVGFMGKPGYLSAAQLRDLGDLGFEVGCHSMTHVYLRGLPASQLSEEVALAKIRLQQLTGRRVDHLSCPGGSYDGRVMQVAQDAGYLSVATSRVAVNRPNANPFGLARIAVTRDLAFGDFQRICRGEGLWKLQVAAFTRTTARRVLGESQYDRLRAAVLNR